MNVDLLIKRNKCLESELAEAEIQLQKSQIDLGRLTQEKQKIHREISNMLALFAEVGEDGLYQNRILNIGFENEIERLGLIRVLIIDRIHDAESFRRENKYLRKLLKTANQ